MIILTTLILGLSQVNAMTPGKNEKPVSTGIEYPKWAVEEKLEGFVLVQVNIEDGEIKVVDAVSNDSRLKKYITAKVTQMSDLLKEGKKEMLLRFDFKLL